MNWLGKNLAWALLGLTLAAGALLTARGKLRWVGEAEPVQQDEHAGEEGDHHEAESHVVGGMVVLDADSVEAAGIRTTPVERGSVGLNVLVPGKITVAENRVAHVTARLEGAIREIFKNTGDPVSVGTPLFSMESPELGEARSSFVAAHTEKTFAERRFQLWNALKNVEFVQSDETDGTGWVELDEALTAHTAAAEDKHLAESRHERWTALRQAGYRADSEDASVVAWGELDDATAAYITSANEKALKESHLSRWKRLYDAENGFKVTSNGETGWLELDEAVAAHSSAVSERSLAERNYDRLKRLFEKGLRTQNELLDAEGDLTRAKVAVETAMGRLRELGKLAENDAARARAEAEFARRKLSGLGRSAENDLTRVRIVVDAALRRLRELGKVAENDRLRANVALDAAEAKLRSLGLADAEITELERNKSRAVHSRHLVRSPVTGHVLERDATPGENVEAAEHLFVVADLSEVWVEASVHERDLSVVRVGMPAHVRMPGRTDRAFVGRVSHVGQSMSQETRTVPIRIVLRNTAMPDGEKFSFRPGMFVTVALETSRRENILVVPLDAVQTVSGETVVFVQSSDVPEHEEHSEEDGHAEDETASHEEQGIETAYEKRAVVTGDRDGAVIEVVKGLQAGERVVTANAYLLKSEFEKSRISEGHAH